MLVVWRVGLLYRGFPSGKGDSPQSKEKAAELNKHKLGTAITADKGCLLYRRRKLYSISGYSDDEYVGKKNYIYANKFTQFGH